MSKKSERRERHKGKVRKQLYSCIFVGIVGLIFLILGIIGVIGNYLEYDDYKNSEEITTVQAEVTYAEIKERKDPNGTVEMYWDAELTYSVAGQKYKGEKEFSTATKTGDIREIEVYRSKNGGYKLPKIKSFEQLIIADIMMIVSIGLGAVLFLIGLIMAIGTGRELKKIIKAGSKGD